MDGVQSQTLLNGIVLKDVISWWLFYQQVQWFCYKRVTKERTVLKMIELFGAVVQKYVV